MTRRPLAIVGPTATGKSALATALAQRHGGVEIISADAMAVYRRMDIGTAKPTAGDRASVRHHLLDVADPAEEFGVARYRQLVDEALGSIDAAHRLPLLVGGTGLYVRAVVDDLRVPGRYPTVAADLAGEPDTVKLHDRLRRLDPAAAARMEPGNRRRVLRALEVTIGSGRPFSSFGPGLAHYGPTRYVQIGLAIDRGVLDARIEERYDDQIRRGFLAEVLALPQPLSRTAGQALGYRELLAHLRGERSLDEAIDEAKTRTRRFARRQQRWFRRDPRIHWIDAGAPDLVDRAERIWEAESDIEVLAEGSKCDTGGA